jgi:hypothetical protein
VRSQLQKALRWQYLGGPVGSLGYDVRMRPTQSNMMYVSDAWAGVFRSADGGPTWTPRNGSSTWVPANDALSQEAHVFGLVMHPSKAFVVYAATYNHGVLMSDNSGQKWQLRDPTPRRVTNPPRHLPRDEPPGPSNALSRPRPRRAVPYHRRGRVLAALHVRQRPE